MSMLRQHPASGLSGVPWAPAQEPIGGYDEYATGCTNVVGDCLSLLFSWYLAEARNAFSLPSVQTSLLLIIPALVPVMPT